MEHWYCLHAKPNAEYLVSASLEWRGLKPYLPLVTSLRSEKTDKRPFFPGYLFLQVNLARVSISSLQWTPGLRRIISFNNEPAVLSDDLIRGIQRIVAQFEDSGGLPIHNFTPGDTVRITNGPLSGLEAIFDEPGNASKRVHVLLEILGQLSRVEINVNDLERTTEVSEPKAKRPRRTRGKGRRIQTTRTRT